MYLSDEQLRLYQDEGFVTVESALSPDEVSALNEAYRRDCAVPGSHRVLESGTQEVRALYSSHLRQREYAALTRDRRLLQPVQQLLGDRVYVYQFKINAKAAFGGEKWSWHQDFAAWQIADNLRAPAQANVAVFLDEVTEFNGPVIFLPGSHRRGTFVVPDIAGRASEQHFDPQDIAIPPHRLAELEKTCGMVAPKGPAGTVVFFSPEIVHGSATNVSPHPRRLLIVTYNDVANLPRWQRVPRAEYLVCRDSTPLEAADEPLATTGKS